MGIENWVILGLGGNMGNRLHQLGRAQELISKQLGAIVKCSSLYETAAWGNTDQPNFINQVVLIKTPFTPMMVIQRCLQIEKQLGRRREVKWGPRIIDIDILLYNNIKLNTQDLQIPHPQLHERRFVLEPLVEIMPHHKHPSLGRTFSELLKHCADDLPVTLFPLS
jgi:2-amino-4-hydroxy-6-hydroxymethyldihydropteridine diphosphokinase